MPNKSHRMVWLDMEMTGLNPDQDRIIEVAVIITEADLSVVAEAPVYVIHQDDAILNSMDKWNTSTHTKSGLVSKVKESKLNEAQVEEALLKFFKEHIPEGCIPLCGNSVNQDRRFMFKYMPKLEKYLHYRTVDVSTFKELAKRWKPEVYNSFKKQGKHEALADIYESIEELKHYREHFIKE
ncbi:oligoribonuclease [Taylorella equigenitalis]|uniref:Oligoribonuclease n=3 Tax=Taylorella equigenitalis TaxID=29575 RepID=A0A654KJ17_TAYEM|nr:oligoribonuclease [Taylorella equigenitalis]ADU92412.1 3'-to-5' oligoribonuclease (orn) [Taylorella equigenitalis MCE9]AFN35966.1 oligoribonuclease [Taylorella equigenitalis ATCC 35865]ASY31239.1 oligoribonuclease [Taylorella equigenitalis]ASY38530.1 oligoribonuclease [Taylorella equigenitalis]ASY40074.1 oligoribonuclease [Taylorella equigenitalis]